MIRDFQYGNVNCYVSEGLEEIIDLKEQIRLKNKIISSAYTLSPVTNIPLVTKRPIEIDSQLLLSIQEYQGKSLIVIRRAKDKVEVASHLLHYYERNSLKFYIDMGDGLKYFFTYTQRGGENWLSVAKAIRPDNEE